jgi:hypothetical protein
VFRCSRAVELLDRQTPDTGDIVLLSVLPGHYRYAHITTLRCDAVNLLSSGGSRGDIRLLLLHFPPSRIVLPCSIRSTAAPDEIADTLSIALRLQKHSRFATPSMALGHRAFCSAASNVIG